MPVFKMLSIALLRLAAWDFEVSSECPEELPITFDSVISWKYQKEDIYWFHGFLIVRQEDIHSTNGIEIAVSRISSYVRNIHTLSGAIHSVLISVHHVAFVELSHGRVFCSDTMPLFTNMSGVQCSPGFRALTRILSTGCWKEIQTYGERWRFDLPLEIFQEILHNMEPREIIALSQASFTVQRWYYNSIPQFRDLNVRRFEYSVPCCGRRDGLDVGGVMCCSCLSWQHLTCLKPGNTLSDGWYVCSSYKEGRTSTKLNPGGINRLSGRLRRRGCPVERDGSAKLLELRFVKPSQFPQDGRTVHVSCIPPSHTDFTILFSGSFCGLVYGLDNATVV